MIVTLVFVAADSGRKAIDQRLKLLKGQFPMILLVSLIALWLLAILWLLPNTIEVASYF